jgi:hypothetical protein
MLGKTRGHSSSPTHQGFEKDEAYVREHMGI